MKKKYRYSIFIASAILACAPLAMNNAMGNNHVVKAAVQPNNQTDSAAKPANDKGTPKPQTDGVSNPGVKSPAESEANKVGQDSKGSNSSESGTKGNLKPVSKALAKTPNTANNGETPETAYQISTSYDKDLHTNIKWMKGLTNTDVGDYFMRHVHFYINHKETSNTTFDHISKNDLPKKENEVGYTTTIKRLETYGVAVSNEKGQDLERSDDDSILLEPNYQVVIGPDFSPEPGHLVPNKWYSWKIYDDDDPIGKLPSEIAKRVKEDTVNHTVAEQTDEYGELPLIQNGKNDYDNLGQGDLANPITFIVSTDSNAIAIPHDKYSIGKPADIVNGVPVVPDGGDKNKDHDADNEINDDIDSNSSNWDNAPVDNGTNFTFTQLPTTKNTETNTKNTDTKNNNKPAVNLKNLVLIHNAIVYDKNGKAVLKHGAYQMKQMHHKIVILDHGKKYRINGQWFYRIGKNEYIKVSSVGTVSKTQKIYTRGTIKASHRYGVKLYSSNGKYLKKFLSKSKKVQFDQKKFMKHAVFYRIKGTKIWVRAANVKLVKGSRK